MSITFDVYLLIGGHYNIRHKFKEYTYVYQ